MEEEGEFVESGTLGVDKELALEKLQRFQLSPYISRSGLWLRTAVASGATRLTIDGGSTWTEYRFGGEPLKETDLAAPYEALFRPESTSSPRDKLFALAYLNTLHRSVKSLEIRSGRGKRRRVLTSIGLGKEAVSREDDAGVDTVVRLRWRFWSLNLTMSFGAFGHPGSERMILSNNPPLFESTPIPVIGRGRFLGLGRVRPVGSGPDGGEHLHQVGETRMHLRSTMNARLGASRFSFYSYGFRVCSLQGIEAPMFFTGWVDDPKLRLNASLTGIVEDERSALVRERFKTELDRLLGEA